jgi:hypothetical protein
MSTDVSRISLNPTPRDVEKTGRKELTKTFNKASKDAPIDYKSEAKILAIAAVVFLALTGLAVALSILSFGVLPVVMAGVLGVTTLATYYCSTVKSDKAKGVEKLKNDGVDSRLRDTLATISQRNSATNHVEMAPRAIEPIAVGL